MPEDGAGPLRVLLVEDDPADVAWFEELLLAVPDIPVSVSAAPSIRAALEHLTAAAPHCIVVDLGLPDADGIESVRRMVAADHHTPVVVLTGNDAAEGLEAVREGADDYLVKEALEGEELVRVIRWAVARSGAQAVRRASAPSLLTTRFVGPAVTVDRHGHIREANAAFHASGGSIALRLGSAIGTALEPVLAEAIMAALGTLDDASPVLAVPADTGGGSNHDDRPGATVVALNGRSGPDDPVALILLHRT